MNPYDVLGVAPDCDNETLKAAYRRLVRENHPDLAGDAVQKKTRTSRMTALNEAWLLIGDPSRRTSYDARRRLDEIERAASKSPVTAVKTATSANRAAAARSAAQAKRNVFARRSVNEAKPKKDARTGRKEARVSSSQLVQVHLTNAIRLFYTEDQPQQAATLCQKALRLDYRNVPARELLGEIYMKQGEWDRARELLKQAVDLQPENVALRRKLHTLGNRSQKSETVRAPQNPAPASVPKRTGANAPLTRESLWQRLRSRIAAR